MRLVFWDRGPFEEIHNIHYCLLGLAFIFACFFFLVLVLLSTEMWLAYVIVALYRLFRFLLFADHGCVSSPILMTYTALD